METILLTLISFDNYNDIAIIPFLTRRGLFIKKKLVTFLDHSNAYINLFVNYNMKSPSCEYNLPSLNMEHEAATPQDPRKKTINIMHKKKRKRPGYWALYNY